MPGFIPKADSPRDADDFTRAYLVCAEWSANELDESEEYQNAERVSWEHVSEALAVAECRAFQAENAEALSEFYALGFDAEQAGHDFYLTRNGHGAGFWDRGAGEVGERLSKAARAWGERHVGAIEGSEDAERDFPLLIEFNW